MIFVVEEGLVKDYSTYILLGPGYLDNNGSIACVSSPRLRFAPPTQRISLAATESMLMS